MQAGLALRDKARHICGLSAMTGDFSVKTSLTQSLLEAVPTPTLLIGRDDRILAANGAARLLLGPEILDRLYVTCLRQPGLIDCIEQGLRQRKAGQGRHVVRGASSDSIYRVIVNPVEGDGQNGVLCTFEDISEQEQIGQMRRDFVANVSHELRTPLTALLGFIETLQGAARNDAAARERFLGVMAREAGRMNRLVGDLLQLSRVEANERVRPTQMVDIAALVGRVVSDLQPLAVEAGVTVTVTGCDRDALVPADGDQMTQVLANLLENAIKYGAAGKVVDVALSHHDPDPAVKGPALRIEVRDKGEGIDEVHLPRLTERFYRVDSHRSREKGGTGLGLAIVKHIINRHRGRLKLASVKGQGSTFTVILPKT
jgi:two-component system, OmpR family, phosphate regulon sensor histidine kinase PhoR